VVVSADAALAVARRVTLPAVAARSARTPAIDVCLVTVEGGVAAAGRRADAVATVATRAIRIGHTGAAVGANTTAAAAVFVGLVAVLCPIGTRNGDLVVGVAEAHSVGLRAASAVDAGAERGGQGEASNEMMKIVASPEGCGRFWEPYLTRRKCGYHNDESVPLGATTFGLA